MTYTATVTRNGYGEADGETVIDVVRSQKQGGDTDGDDEED